MSSCRTPRNADVTITSTHCRRLGWARYHEYIELACNMHRLKFRRYFNDIFNLRWTKYKMLHTVFFFSANSYTYKKVPKHRTVPYWVLYRSISFHNKSLPPLYTECRLKKKNKHKPTDTSDCHINQVHAYVTPHMSHVWCSLPHICLCLVVCLYAEALVP